MLLFSSHRSFTALCSKLIDIYIAPLTLTAEGQSMKLAGVSLQLKRLREIMVRPTERWGCMRGSSGHHFTPTVLRSQPTAAVPRSRGQGRSSSTLSTGGPFIHSLDRAARHEEVFSGTSPSYRAASGEAEDLSRQARMYLQVNNPLCEQLFHYVLLNHRFLWTGTDSYQITANSPTQKDSSLGWGL